MSLTFWTIFLSSGVGAAACFSAFAAKAFCSLAFEFPGACLEQSLPRVFHGEGQDFRIWQSSPRGR